MKTKEVENERLTEWVDGKAIPRMDLRYNGHERCLRKLAILEDKEQPKLVKILRLDEDVKVGNLNFKAGCKLEKCPACDSFISNDTYCRYCGQRLRRYGHAHEGL